MQIEGAVQGVASTLGGVDPELLAFALLSAVTLAAAVAVLWTRQTVRAVVFLAAVFAGVSGLLFLLGAEFLAVVQLLINGGAVTVLILFAAMLTTRETLRA
ncbi:MAG: NADH-quinone oxidoreductase subunit J [Halobacteria archaeon]